MYRYKAQKIVALTQPSLSSGAGPCANWSKFLLRNSRTFQGRGQQRTLTTPPIGHCRRDLQPRQSASVPIVVLALIAATFGAISIYLRTIKGVGVDADTRAFESQPLQEMTSQGPPGRPGNLTPEQEIKVRELWQATLRLFGVLDKTAGEPNGTTVNPSVTAADKDPEKKKKGKLHIFKRQRKEADVSESSSLSQSTSDLTSGVDEDDKHGLGKEFKAAIATTPPEELRSAFWSMVKHDHPDGLQLRFLRARKWDVHAALVMMISTMHWRAQEMHVDDDVIKEGELGALEASKTGDSTKKKHGDDFLAQLRMGKSFLHGTDKEGRPMCFVRVRLHRQGEQSEESLERYTVYTIETARMLLRPPVDTATIVFDMTNFSLANMDYTPVKFMIKCFEANYPESLGAVLVHKAPWVFQGIWNIIRGWLDPVVAGKVHFTKNTEELSNYVAMEQIPKEMGGNENYEYEYIPPSPDENSQMENTEARDEILNVRKTLALQFESVTVQWINGEQDTKEALKERSEIATKLRDNYWELDPYVRARTLYDRLGVIGPKGVLDFYPKAPKQTISNVQTSSDDVD